MNFISFLTIAFAAVSCTNAFNACPAIYAPVCGSDGLTYPSKCFLEAAQQQGDSGLTLAHTGPCRARRAVADDGCPEYSKQGICTLEYAPVCASNGQTYPNKCSMCADMYRQGVTLSVTHRGVCTPFECPERSKQGICTMEYNPVCGSDGVSYGNPCDFCFNQYKSAQNGGHLSFHHMGEC